MSCAEHHIYQQDFTTAPIRPRKRGEPGAELGVASWNLGGLSGNNILELT